MNNSKRVYEARDPAEAELVKGLLEAEGIVGTVQQGALETIFGEMAGNSETLPSVWVRESDVDTARKIIEEFNRVGLPVGSTGSNWTCPGCGETLEAQFSSCWKCNTARTGSSA
jgi:predicted RNA-binding Zn-ribbon protein involved in translation (DUF1610 family)